MCDMTEFVRVLLANTVKSESENEVPAEPVTKKQRGRYAKYLYLEASESREDVKEKAIRAGLKYRDERNGHIYFVCKTQACSYKWKSSVSDDFKYIIYETEDQHNHGATAVATERKVGLSNEMKDIIDKRIVRSESVNAKAILQAFTDEGFLDMPTSNQVKNYVQHKKKNLVPSENVNLVDDENRMVSDNENFVNVITWEGLVSALAEPSTSGISNGDNDEITAEKSPPPSSSFNKMEDWILVGTFNDHQSVELARNAGKVVRHSIIPMKQGSKVKYRCNQWKRTHCPYRMHYVEQNGIYQLYSKGQHNHSILGDQSEASSSSAVNFEASDEPQHFMETEYLQSIISHAIQATTFDPKNDAITEYAAAPLILEEQQPQVKSETDASPCLTLPENLLNVFHEAVQKETSENFTLSNSISNLLEVATEHQLVFTFDARNAAEFCFSKSSNPEMIVFVDFGTDVIVKRKHNDFIVNEERWRKADATQFIWAVRGILAKTFSS